MGAGLVISLEKEIPGLDTLVDGKAFAWLMPDLEEHARTNNLTPLSTLISYSQDEIDDHVEAAGIDPSEVEAATDKWFDAQEGLKAVRALLDLLQRAPLKGDDTIGNDDVVGDLKDYERVLAEADKAKIRFHFSMFD